MKSSKKQQTFSEFFASFLKAISDFEHFKTEDDLIAYSFSKLLAAKNMVR